MKNIFLITMLIFAVGCGSNSGGGGSPAAPITPDTPAVDNNVYFPIVTATINVTSYGDLAFVKPKRNKMLDLIIPMAYAQAQGSATISVVYNNPSATAFAVNTAAFGNALTVVGDELNFGTISVSGLDDNTLNVCTGVGAPGNKCNRLYIRVFTLGTAASGSITGVGGFINTAQSYGIPVYAGSVTTALGFNPSATAASVTNAATVYTYTIPNNRNRVRLNDLSIPSIPIKADLSNAGSGPYEMNLVVQYALGYQ